MTGSTPESRARLLYSAYGHGVGFVNFRGEPMPAFDDLTPRRQQAWQQGAQAIWDLATTGKTTLRGGPVSSEEAAGL